MSAPLKNILIAGATGSLGKPVYEHLLTHPAGFSLTVLTRDSSNATFSPKVRVIQTDYSADSLRAAVKGQDAVVSTIRMDGSSAKFQETLINVAVEEGVKRFIPSDFGGDFTNDAFTKVVKPLGSKVEQNKLLRDYEKSGMSWTSIETGPFCSYVHLTHFFGYDIENAHAIVQDNGDTVWFASTLPMIARAVAGVLTHPAETANKSLKIASAVMTQDEFVKSLEKRTGRTFTRETRKFEDELKKGEEALERGDVMSGIKILIPAMVVAGKLIDNKEGKIDLSNQMLGLEEPNIDKALEEAGVPSG